MPAAPASEKIDPAPRGGGLLFAAAATVTMVLLVAGSAAAEARLARATQAEFTGAELYAQHCARCHSQGIAGAPRPGVPGDWNERLTGGRATLLLSVIKGQGNMPPKGGNASLTTVEAESALGYMLSAPAR